jgi:ribosomal-protein-alanine N-acetyltransferase
VRANPSDLNTLVELERACFSEPWNRKALSEGLSDEKYLILLLRDDNGGPLGYLIGWHVGDEAELARMGVAPEIRGRGLSKNLLDEALHNWRVAGVKLVFLEVRASNLPALRLYTSRGFETISKRARYYEDGEDALVLRLEFNPNSPN